jgi:hypothetical protein
MTVFETRRESSQSNGKSRSVARLQFAIAAKGLRVGAWTLALTMLIHVVCRPTTYGEDAPGAEISFNRDIRPILSDKCFQCHGPDASTREVDLRFDHKDSALTAIQPGSVEDSKMMVRILEEDPDVQMPPPEAHKPLEESEIRLLEAWIEQGAKWDEFWAYVPPKWHPVPQLQPSDLTQHWIDVMVQQRLKSLGTEPSPVADKVTLVRRLYFDLIGLPPTPQQVADFVDASSGDAYAELVDSLLDSKHFGERLAMYWLDLVRYADTVGYHGDQEHNIAPYRDWVINAFNDNMRFDQFTRDQLAGDLASSPTLQQQIATGYNRLLQTTHEGGLQPKEYRAIYAADRVRNVSAVWMGATIGCAQCHDHKYDPYTTKDFYALSAFFADIDDEEHFSSGTNLLPTRRSPEILVFRDESHQSSYEEAKLAARRVAQELEQVKAELAKHTKTSEGEAGSEAVSQTLEDLKRRVEEAEGRRRQLDRKVTEHESQASWTMITRALPQPREVRVLPRGNWLDETGPVVGPAIPEFMGKVNDGTQQATRMELAQWLTDASQDSGKLTARVFMNRIWYLFMGVGISKSLDDFGGQGEAPVFPELLDNLAVDFATDWDIQRAIRQIVMSETYRQTSLCSEELRRLDPYNQWFARQSRYRLPAETIRDNSLAIAGLLNIEFIGGKSVKPYQPAGYYRHLNFPVRTYSHSKDADQWRRGVYVHWQRQFLHPTLKALDAPSREECTCERPRSNTPLAALALLNDPSFVESARVFAERIVRESRSNSFSDRLDFAFRWTVSRAPSDQERELLLKVFEESFASFEGDLDSAKQLLATGQAPIASQGRPEELAAWTTVARAILNTNEAISRN